MQWQNHGSYLISAASFYNLMWVKCDSLRLLECLCPWRQATQKRGSTICTTTAPTAEYPRNDAHSGQICSSWFTTSCHWKWCVLYGRGVQGGDIDSGASIFNVGEQNLRLKKKNWLLIRNRKQTTVSHIKVGCFIAFLLSLYINVPWLPFCFFTWR